MTSGIKFHRVSAMFGGEHFKLPHVQGPQVQSWLNEIGFKVPFNPRSKLNLEFDLPYLMGYDTKSWIVYGDKDFDPKSYDEGDASETLLTHEEVEKMLERFGLNYQQRHHIATHCENLCVDYKKWDWNAYTRWTTRSWHAAYAKWSGRTSGLRVPATLDMSPYRDEDDKLIKAMRQAGAKDSGEES